MSFLSMGFTPAGYNKGNNRETRLAKEAADLRNKAGLQSSERAQFLRDRWKRLYKPMEEGLAAEVMAGYEPDDAKISDQAMTDVGESFQRAGGDYNRSAARMGLSQEAINDPEVQRLRGHDETLSKIYAANTATNQAHDRADQLTATRGAQITALGAQRPYLAAGESLAGGTAMADLVDYDAMRQARANAEFADADTQMAGGSMWREGGTVKNPMRSGLNPPIEGKAKRVYEDGGSVSYPWSRNTVPADGGNLSAFQGGGQKYGGTMRGRPVDNGGMKNPGGMLRGEPVTTYKPGLSTDVQHGGINPGGMYTPEASKTETYKAPVAPGQSGPYGGSPTSPVVLPTTTGEVPRQISAGGQYGGINPGGMYTPKPANGIDLAPIKTAPAASATLVANDRFAGINPDSSVTKNIGRMKAYADGGSVTDTVRLKNKHTEAYSTGETDKQFGPWLEENGYQLGDDGQVKPKGDAKVIAQKQPDTRPRTPDFLFKPRVYQNKPKNYAEGGLVDVAPVALESEDFIVPEDVVRAVGTVYLDKLVEGGVA